MTVVRSAAKILALLVSFLFVCTCHAGHYRYIDKGGNICFTDNLQNVPVEQRKKIEETEDPEYPLTQEMGSKKKETGAETGEKCPGKEASGPSLASVETLEKERELLEREKTELDKSIAELEKRRAELEEEKGSMSFIRYNEEIVQLNEQYRENNERIVNYNRRVKAHARKIADQ
ncbi:MAG: hypothetical protein BA873_10070 [Desulfobulbaceae bacterium C00003063]|nr:MAG: hypothetical protein BA873_10070 [Desulfobulbaceae bacterium C00003063]